MADEFEDFDDIDALMADGDDLDMELGDDPSKPTSTIDQISQGVTDSIGFDNIDVTASKLKNSMLDTLPGKLGDGLYDAENSVDTLVETFDKELKPLKSATVETLGSLAEVLPEGMAESVRSLKSWIKGDDDSYGMDREPTEEEKIKAEVDGILVKSAIEEQINSKISNLQAKKDSELLSMIAEATAKTSVYKSEYDSNYYKRSLELQLKQVMTSVKIFELLKSDSEKRNLQFEALVKNTALPDFAKSRTSDIAKGMVLDVGKDAISNAFTKNDAIKNLTKFGKEKVATGLSTAAEMVGLGSDLANIAQQELESGGNLVSLITNMVTDAVVNKGLKKTSEYGLKKLYESKGGVKVLGDWDTFVSDPEAALDKVKKEHIENGGAEDDYKSLFLDGVKEAIGTMYAENGTTISDISDMREAAMLDNKFKKSVDTVIPGYLSKILNELTVIRKLTGTSSGGSGNGPVNSRGTKQYNKNNDAPSFDDELVFDFNKGTFTSKGRIKKDISKKIDDHVANMASSIASASIDEYLTPEHLSIDERTELSVAIAKYILDGKTLAPSNLKTAGFLSYIKDNKDLKKKVSKGLSILETPENELQFKRRMELDTKLKGIKQSNISNFRDIAKDADLNNTQDVLLDIGLTTEDDPNHITVSNRKKAYVDRIEKQTEGKYEESKLSLNEKIFIEKTKEKAEKLKERNSKKDDTNRKARDREKKQFKNNEIGGNGYDLGYEIGSSSTEEQTKIFKEKTKDLKPEEITKFKNGYELGVKRNVAESVIDQDFKDKKIQLAKRSERGIQRATKKMAESEKADFLERASKETTLEELKNIGSFNFGGWTLPGEDDEVGGIVHKNEYVINRKKLETLINSVASGNGPKLISFTTDIIKDIDKQPNKFKIPKSLDKISKKLTESVSNVKEKALDVIGEDNIDKVNEFYKEHDDIIKPIETIGKETYKQSKEALANGYEKGKKIVKELPKDRDEIKDAVKSLSSSITKTLDNVTKSIPMSFKDVGSSVVSIGETLSSGFDSTRNTLKDTFSVQIKAMSDLTDVIFKEGTMLGDLKDSTTKVLNKQLDTAKSFIGKSTEDVVKEMKEKGFFETDKDGNIKGINVDETTKIIKDKVNEISTDDEGKENLFGKLLSGTKSMVGSTIGSVKAVLSSTIDVTPDMLEDMKEMKDIISRKGVEPIMKRYLASKPLPTNELSAKGLYRAMFTTMDPSGTMWEKVILMPNYLEDIEKVHVAAIEEGQKGLLGRALDAGDEMLGKGKTLLGDLKGKVLNALPPSLRGPAEKLLNKLGDSRIAKFAGNTLKNVKNVAKGALGTIGDEMRIIGQEGKQLFINDDGKLQIPNAIKLAKFAGSSYMRSMKAVGKGTREFYGGVLGKRDYDPTIGGVGGRFNPKNYVGTKGVLTDAVGIAGKAAWNFTGGAVGKGIKRSANKAWAKVKPPVNRELYNAWLDGNLTAKDVTNALRTDEEKQKWHDWLKANTKPGITLPSILLKGGEWFLEGMVGTGNTTRKGYGVAGKILSSGAKVVGKVAAEVSGFNDITRSIKRRFTTPDIDPELFAAWKDGSLTGKQVEEALQTQEEKDIWIKWLTGNTSKHRSLPKLLNLTGKWYVKGMKKASEGVNTSYKSGFKKSSVVGGLAAKAAFVVSGLDTVLNSGDK